VIEGAAEAIASLLKTVSGRIADKTSRRIELVFGGYALSAISKPLIALAHVWPSVLIARLLDRTGKGLRGSPRDAILADSIEPDLRGSAFGWHRAMDTTGAVVGPLLALGLLWALNHDLRRVIGLSAVPGLIGALLVLSVADPRRRSTTPTAENPEQPTQASSGSRERLTWSAIPHDFKLYLGAWLPFVLVNSSDVFLILRARQLGFSATGIVLVYVLYNAVYAVASVPLGHLSDRFGRRHLLVAGMAVFATVYAGFALASRPWQVVGLFAAYGLYIAATDGVGKAFAVDLVPCDLRATSIGMLSTLTGITALVASAAAGVLWQSVGSWAPFALGAVGALVSATAFGLAPGFKRAPGGVVG
jgi:MFS family permease